MLGMITTTQSTLLEGLRGGGRASRSACACGSHFTMAINGRQVLEADDPGGYSAGRIALYASRLIATFESLEVTPLD